MEVVATAASKWNLNAMNFALDCAVGLVSPEPRRNGPTDECLPERFKRGLSDSHRRRSIQPPRRSADVSMPRLTPGLFVGTMGLDIG